MTDETGGREPILTLEPFSEAVREGLERAGWSLSGLQKTTSHQFEGRWEGEETRSAYLFFHRDDLPNHVSIDAFLDESTDRLRGNLALVVSGPPLAHLPDLPGTLDALARASDSILPQGYRAPISLRLHLAREAGGPGEAEVEVRFKLHLPDGAMEAGRGVVSSLAATVARAFDELLQGSPVDKLLAGGER